MLLRSSLLIAILANLCFFLASENSGFAEPAAVTFSSCDANCQKNNDVKSCTTAIAEYKTRLTDALDACKEIGPKFDDKKLSELSTSDKPSKANACRYATDTCRTQTESCGKQYTDLMDSDEDKQRKNKDLEFEKLQKELDKDPTANAQPTASPLPLPNDPHYCDDFDAVADAADPTSKKGKKDGSDNSQSMANETVCSQLSAQKKVDVLDDSLKSEKEESAIKQKDTDKASLKQSEAMQQCGTQSAQLKALINAKELDIQSQMKHMSDALGQNNTALQHQLNQIQAQIDQDNQSLNDNIGPQRQQALADYQLAMNKAIASCRSDMSKNPNATHFQNFNAAISAANAGGLVSSYCGRDFNTLAAQSAAQQAYQITIQKLQVDYNRIQAKITAEIRNLNNTKLQGTDRQQAIGTAATDAMSADQLAINQANQQQQILDYSCNQQQGVFLQNLAGDRFAAEDAARAQRRTACQLREFRTHPPYITPDRQRDDDTEKLQKLSDRLSKLGTDPCQATCLAVQIDDNADPKNPGNSYKTLCPDERYQQDCKDSIGVITPGKTN